MSPSSIKFADTYLYTWVEKGAVRVKCLAQEHNILKSPARARTQSAGFRVQRTHHWTTAPPTFAVKEKLHLCDF